MSHRHSRLRLQGGQDGCVVDQARFISVLLFLSEYDEEFVGDSDRSNTVPASLPLASPGLFPLFFGGVRDVGCAQRGPEEQAAVPGRRDLRARNASPAAW